MFPGDYYEALGAKLDKIYNDLLGMHLCMVASQMYEVGIITQNDYIQILNKEYDIISEQLAGL